MLACPINSCTARRSCELCSTCDANEVAQAMGINVTGNALLQCAQLECAPHHWRTDAFTTGTNKQGRQSHPGHQR